MNALNEILKRYDKYTGRLNIPGDWGERAFRGWLILDFLSTELGWPSTHIILGERFDILLLNDSLHPVVNIETKKPRSRIIQKEKKDFLNRLSMYPTLEWAFLTNGIYWGRFRLLAPEGNQKILEKAEFELEKASEKTTKEFFEVISRNHYLP
ncbi:MAG: hypothetical protein ABSB25_03140 [Sedimentisphaerales bacterium]